MPGRLPFDMEAERAGSFGCFSFDHREKTDSVERSIVGHFDSSDFKNGGQVIDGASGHVTGRTSFDFGGPFD